MLNILQWKIRYKISLKQKMTGQHETTCTLHFFCVFHATVHSFAYRCSSLQFYNLFHPFQPNYAEQILQSHILWNFLSHPNLKYSLPVPRSLVINVRAKFPFPYFSGALLKTARKTYFSIKAQIIVTTSSITITRRRTCKVRKAGHREHTVDFHFLRRLYP